MRESELLAHILASTTDLSSRFAHVIAGPGHDCAVLAAPTGPPILATVDHLIEGRHFAAPAGRVTSLDLVARKAIARSVSDIAASGGSLDSWGAALATAALPRGFPGADADELFDRMRHWAAHWRCPLVGGDIATFGEGGCAGPLTLTVTVLGLAHPVRGPVLRSGAAPGDGVYVTGALGGSLASGRHLAFEPRLREARELCDLLGPRLHAMMDISDGLGRDGARLAASSGTDLVLDLGALPRHAGIEARDALRDGEDYELLFCTAPGAAIPSRCAGTPVTRIGTVAAVSGRAPRCLVTGPGGVIVDASAEGWDHS